MKKEIISTEKAPAAIGPYSQATKLGDFIFTSGQLPIDIGSGELINDDIKKATAKSLDNIKAILEEVGSDMENIVKATIFLKDMNDFGEVNEVYGTYFSQGPPARSCVQVAKLPKDARIEIEVIARG